ncbi:kelch-like protein 26 isoform X1 [Drosophila subobscura]|uniref:kelch-like protein 26 isoform X1 n=1 Tax=Drosophila subobscura TaxID=7241 RepID=UPI00155AA5FF|nr:kelch-like protein 26 isoform X1 [Drosophila subobscura]
MSSAQTQTSGEEDSLLSGLNKLRLEEKLTDVTLIADGISYQAHRVVLAASSDYFCAMFADSAMIETRKKKISLHGITGRALGSILDYIYTSRLELNIDNIEETLAAASIVQVRDVIDRCTFFLQHRIGLDNCLAVATMAEIYGQLGLSARAFRYMCCHFKEFSAGPDFKEMSVDQMRFILSSNYPIDVSEQELARLVCAYCLDQRLENEVAFDLLRLINWPHINYTQLHVVEAMNCSIDDKVQRPLPAKYFDRIRELYLSRLLKGELALEDQTVRDLPTNLRGMELSLLKIGGFEWKGLTNEIMCFSPSKMKWYELTTIPHIDQCESVRPFVCNFGTAVLNNELFIVGGAYDVYLKEYIHPFGFRYCPLRNSWVTIAPIQLDRCRFSLNAVGNQYLYAVGGIVENDDTTEEGMRRASNVERYSLADNKWTYMPCLQENRSQHAGVVVGDKLYISGGIYMAVILSSFWCFDTKVDTWLELASMPTECCDHVLVACDDLIYACGGWHENQAETRVLVQHIYAYSIKTNTWQVETRIPAPKFYSGITMMGRTIFFVGGLDSTETIDRASSATMAYNVDRKCWWHRKDSWDTPSDVWESTCAALYVPICDS